MTEKPLQRECFFCGCPTLLADLDKAGLCPGCHDYERQQAKSDDERPRDGEA